MARTKGPVTNPNPMLRKGGAATPKTTSSRPAPAPNTVKKPGKKGTQQQPVPSDSVATGRVKKGQATTVRKSTERAAPKPASVHPDNYDFDPRQEYKIQGIMDENDKKYLIRWAGKDSAGGDFVDTSVPKANANQHATRDWASRIKDNRRDSFNESESDDQRPKQKKKTKAATKKSTKDGAGKAKGKK